MNWVHGMPMVLDPIMPSNKISIGIDMWPCWVNDIRMKKHGMDPSLDNQLVRTSKIGLSQTNWPLCILVVVDNVIIIKWQIHNYLNCVLLSTIIANQCGCKCTNAKTFENIMYVSSKKHQGFGQQSVFCKKRGCIDKSSSTDTIASMYICVL